MVVAQRCGGRRGFSAVPASLPVKVAVAAAPGGGVSAPAGGAQIQVDLGLPSPAPCGAVLGGVPALIMVAGEPSGGGGASGGGRRVQWPDLAVFGQIWACQARPHLSPGSLVGGRDRPSGCRSWRIRCWFRSPTSLGETGQCSSVPPAVLRWKGGSHRRKLCRPPARRRRRPRVSHPSLEALSGLVPPLRPGTVGHRRRCGGVVGSGVLGRGRDVVVAWLLVDKLGRQWRFGSAAVVPSCWVVGGVLTPPRVGGCGGTGGCSGWLVSMSQSDRARSLASAWIVALELLVCALGTTELFGGGEMKVRRSGSAVPSHPRRRRKLGTSEIQGVVCQSGLAVDVPI